MIKFEELEELSKETEEYNMLIEVAGELKKQVENSIQNASKKRNNNVREMVNEKLSCFGSSRECCIAYMQCTHGLYYREGNKSGHILEKTNLLLHIPSFSLEEMRNSFRLFELTR
jgi:hypothetical protein